MNGRLLLYVSRAGASLARWERGSLRDIRALPADAEGWGQFSDTLRQTPGWPVYMVVDAVEEHYRREVLPHAWGRDRREMTQRRLRQILHQTPYRAVLPQGPATAGQVGDRYLFMGLTAPELVQPWVEVVRLRDAHLAGIWLVPVLSPGLIERFRLSPRPQSRLLGRFQLLTGLKSRRRTDDTDEGDRLLLVSEQTGGLRLSFFDQGELRFSRLAPGEGSNPADPLAGHLEQIERTRQSLLAQRLLRRGDALRVCLVDPLNTLGGLKEHLSADEGWQCDILSRERLLAGFKLPPALLTESSDTLTLALLIQAPASGNLLPEDEQRKHRQKRLHRLLRVAATLWLVATVGLGLALVLDAWRLTHTAETLEAQARLAREKVEQMLAAQGGSARFESLWQIHTAWQWVMAQRADPATTLERIATLAGAHPHIRLTQVRWIGPQPPRQEQLWLEGEVLDFAGDYRLAHARIEALAGELRRSGWRTDVTRWPLDVAPHLEVQGNLGRDQVGQTARFGLTLRAEAKSRALAGNVSELMERAP